jgi:hypothetical protein
MDFSQFSNQQGYSSLRQAWASRNGTMSATWKCSAMSSGTTILACTQTQPVVSFNSGQTWSSFNLSNNSASALTTNVEIQSCAVSALGSQMMIYSTTNEVYIGTVTMSNMTMTGSGSGQIVIWKSYPLPMTNIRNVLMDPITNTIWAWTWAQELFVMTSMTATGSWTQYGTSTITISTGSTITTTTIPLKLSQSTLAIRISNNQLYCVDRISGATLSTLVKNTIIPTSLPISSIMGSATAAQVQKATTDYTVKTYLTIDDPTNNPIFFWWFSYSNGTSSPMYNTGTPITWPMSITATGTTTGISPIGITDLFTVKLLDDHILWPHKVT